MSIIQVTEPIDRFTAKLKAGKLKGKTRITLEDISTRRRQVFEDENIITNAIGEIFASNYLGMTDFYNMQPIGTKLLGGVMLFNETLTESATNIFPPAENVNSLIAHAGQTPIPTSYTGTKRGNPNGTASVIDPENGIIKHVWDWSLENGNGAINSVALTSGAGGDFGLFPHGDTMIQPYGLSIENISNMRASTFGNTYNLVKSYKCPFELAADGNGISVFVTGNTFTETTVRHPFTRPELVETVTISDSNFRKLSERTATLTRSFTANYFVIAADNENYYVIERDSSVNTRLYVNIISKTDMTVTAETINISGATLARPQMQQSSAQNGIVSGGNIYWVSGSDSKTFIRINIETPADVEILTSELTDAIITRTQPIVISDGLILGENFLINGSTVYKVTRRVRREKWTSTNQENYFNQFETIAKYKNSPFMYQAFSTQDTSTYNYMTRGGVLLLPYLGSVNNLQNEVVKDQNKTMRVEYSIVETD